MQQVRKKNLKELFTFLVEINRRGDWQNQQPNQGVQTFKNGPSRELTEEKNGGVCRRCYSQEGTECLALVLRPR